MSVPATLPDGSPGEAVAFQGETLHAVLPRAFAPGAPVQLALAFPSGSTTVRGKTQHSKRRQDGRFDVHMRVLDLRRDDRQRLESL